MKFEEWVNLGNKIKEIQAILMDEHLKYNKTSYDARKIGQAMNYFDKVKDKLDDLVCQQFPDEITATAVFYGPIRKAEDHEDE